MKVNLLSDKKMRELGFMRRESSRWYFFEDLGLDITFSMWIELGEEIGLKIDVLDESFLQPYDYQYMLKEIPDHKFANKVDKQVRKIMLQFVDAGLIEGYTDGDYI